MSEKRDASEFFGTPKGLKNVEAVYADMNHRQISLMLGVLRGAIELARPVKTSEYDLPLRILDAACGTGNKDPVIAEHFRAQVTAVTPFSSELEHASTKNKHRDVTYKKSGMPHYTELEGHKYDIVYSNCAFQYMNTVAERQASLKRFRSLLEPAGVLVLEYPTGPTMPDVVSYHPKLELFRAEVTHATKGFATIISLKETADPFHERRQQPVKIIQMLLQNTPP